jgi:hypothetical protein
MVLYSSIQRPITTRASKTLRKVSPLRTSSRIVAFKALHEGVLLRRALLDEGLLDPLGFEPVGERGGDELAAVV